MPNWSTDISTAPRGKRVTTRQMVNDKVVVKHSADQPMVWLATMCGKVLLSRWIWPRPKPKLGQIPHGRWQMLGALKPEQPLGWRAFVEGEFPKKQRPAFPAELLDQVEHAHA